MSSSQFSGNRTPMEAVKDADGREIVESLVIQGERSGRSPNMPTDEDVFRRLRERLGLTGSREQFDNGFLYNQLSNRACDRNMRHEQLG